MQIVLEYLTYVSVFNNTILIQYGRTSTANSTRTTVTLPVTYGTTYICVACVHESGQQHDIGANIQNLSKFVLNGFYGAGLKYWICMGF